MVKVRKIDFFKAKNELVEIGRNELSNLIYGPDTDGRWYVMCCKDIYDNREYAQENKLFFFFFSS